MEVNKIELVDRGRGMQLSTSRITVADLVPFFRVGYGAEEILRSIPSLSIAEIAVIQDYYQSHEAELIAADDRVEAYRKEQMRLQKLRFPPFEGTREELIKLLWERVARRKELNGDLTSR